MAVTDPLPFLEQAGIFTYHRSLVTDAARTEAFHRAINATVRPEDVVLDLGCGTGILACLACRAGARRVYAIESGPVVELARLVVRENGLADRITFIPRSSLEAELPEPVDLVISETLGNFGIEEGLLDWVLDARRRFLRPGGRIVPHTVELVIVPVSAPDLHEKLDGWHDEVEGLSFSALARLAVNNVYALALDAHTLLGEPAGLGRIDLGSLESPDFRGTAQLFATRGGVLHGIGGWFTADLTADVRLTNAPPNAAPNWSHRFFPLERPVEVHAGDRMDVAIGASAAGTRWSWEVRVEGGGAGGAPAIFRQSTLSGFPRQPG